MSVPSAVVVSAITVATPLMPCLVKNGRNVTTSQARPSVIPPCKQSDFALMSGESFGVDFVAGEQEQERHAELVQEFHGVVYFDHA